MQDELFLVNMARVDHSFVSGRRNVQPVKTKFKFAQASVDPPVPTLIIPHVTVSYVKHKCTAPRPFMKTKKKNKP